MPVSMRRRALLGVGAAAGAALAAPWLRVFSGCGVDDRNSRSPLAEAESSGGTKSSAGGSASIVADHPGADAAVPTAGGAPDLEIGLRAIAGQAQLLKGRATAVWTLEGSVMRGGAGALIQGESGALGPTFHVERGQRIRVLLDNHLSEDTIIHWHGLHVPAAMDGHPRDAIPTGQRYTYEFEVKNRAGTYLYHAHPHQRTGEQVYRGMAGLFIVHDSTEDELSLPRDSFDVALAIQDRVFDQNNQLVYTPSGVHATNGWLGDRVIVNGVPDYVLPVATRPYRLRLANASNARIYRLAWDDGTPLTVIGTDGGLLAMPVTRPYVMLGPGERVELWANFAGRPMNTELRLVSLEFDGGGGFHGTSSGLPQGAALPIMTVRVDRANTDKQPLRETLGIIEELDTTRATFRDIAITMQHMNFALNGRTFVLDEVASDERVALGSVQLWQFDNSTAAGHMGMHGAMGVSAPHPIHIHGGQFRVLARSGVTHEGYVDDGWKDTVLLMPGERARVAMRFDDYAGLYLYHCHNLEHEDLGMMRNFLIEG